MVSMSETLGEAGGTGPDTTAGVSLHMGMRLREAREAAGMSVEAAAAQLRLSPRQITALEGEQFEQLPGRTFVRGFVKNYARLLNLDPEPLLAYAGNRLDRPVLHPITDGMGVIPTEHGIASVWQKWAILAALVAALLAGAGYEWWQRQSRLSTPSTPRTVLLPPTTSPAPAGLPEVRELPAPPSASTDSGAAPAAPERSVRSDMAPEARLATSAQNAIAATGESREAAPDEPAPTPAPRGSLAPRLPAAAGKIGLQFTDTSWVEIRERSGRVVISQHYSAGQSTLIQGEPPFEIIVGNAAATRLSFDGKAIDLNTLARQNVARLTLP